LIKFSSSTVMISKRTQGSAEALIRPDACASD
jgi:hypothetical protein